MKSTFRTSLVSRALASVLAAQSPVAVAGIIDGTFELDGNAIKNPSLAGDDWSVLFPTDAGSVALAKAFVTDTATSVCGDSTVFTSGASKDIFDISSWPFTCGTS